MAIDKSYDISSQKVAAELRGRNAEFSEGDTSDQAVVRDFFTTGGLDGQPSEEQVTSSREGEFSVDAENKTAYVYKDDEQYLRQDIGTVLDTGDGAQAPAVGEDHPDAEGSGENEGGGEQGDNKSDSDKA